ncbi:MAG TPA: hydrolase 1, exosortase A system-associated [Albitalea sp.]|nr:hydrolase 1, exosortase A system-associated [Albitalea sp.]
MMHTDVGLVFECAGDTLVGVLSKPTAPLATAVVVVVGGPQYRAGSHRQFVLLAHALAQAGFPVLRFDVRGMGDSSGVARSFESIGDDIGCALAALHQAMPGIERVVLWGLCDGASAALMYVETNRDARVAGLCLVNPWVRSEASLARTQVKHYYTQRLMQREFWLKLLRGGVGAQALRSLAGSVRRAVRSTARASRGTDGGLATGVVAYQHRMAVAWQGFGGPVLLLLSGDDYTAKEFLEFIAVDPAWRGALARAGVQRQDLAGADHTFSNPTSREQAEAATLAWLSRHRESAAHG